MHELARNMQPLKTLIEHRIILPDDSILVM